MADTVHLLVAGGVQEHDLPLHWAIQEQVDKGVIGRVNPDGTPWEPEPDKPARRTAAKQDK